MVVKLEADDITEDGLRAIIRVPEELEPYIHYDSETGEQDVRSTFYAMYPASAVAPGNLYYNQAFTETNDLLMAACNVDNVFVFYNLCGVVSFRVKGDYDSYVFAGNNKETVGYDVYQVRVRDTGNGPSVNYLKPADSYKTLTPKLVVKGDVVADGHTENFVCLPAGATFEEGFNIKLIKDGKIVKIAESSALAEVAPGVLLNLGSIDAHLNDFVPPTESDHESELPIDEAIDLSTEGTANCYIVDAPGLYKFPAVMGNSKETPGNVFGAKLVWETYNNAQEVVENSVIAAVDFEDNWICFQTPETLQPGNAVIAALNFDEEIIWSWHIWIPETPVDYIYSVNICKQAAMDRNLGALRVTETEGDGAAVESYGLMYQWGRKDPFPGPKRVDSSTLALIAGTPFVLKDQTKESYDSNNLVTGFMTIDETIQNPTVFGNVGGGDWDPEETEDRWSAEEKTIYDPCPVGYKVMDREQGTVLWNESNIATAATSAGMKWNSSLEGHWFSVTDKKGRSLVFPLSGYIDDSDTKTVPYLEYPGKRAGIWSTYNAIHLNIREDKVDYHKAGWTSAARACAVRCVLIETPEVDPDPDPEPDPEPDDTIDLSERGTANCYIVYKAGAYKFPAVKGNSEESVGEVDSADLIWETYNNATSVSLNSVIATVGYEDEWVYFTTPETLHPGNALIAAKNEAGDILWSWHIWIPATTVKSVAAGIHPTDVMDRNLGALVVAEASDVAPVDITSVGMFYQWGRKDPFFGPRMIDEGQYVSKARYAGTEWTADKVQISVEESIQQPTFFARGLYVDGSQVNPDWCTDSDAEYWGDTGGKTIYDPCPVGYRVPTREKKYSLWADDITTNEGWEYDAEHYWFKVGNPATVFPAVGWYDGGSLKSTFRAGIWNAHSDSWTNDAGYSHYAGYARRIYFESSAFKQKNSSVNKSLGYNVRCVKIDNSFVDPDPDEDPNEEDPNDEDPIECNIVIDGDLSDWADIPGAATPGNICKEMKIINDDDYFYFYLSSAPGNRGSQLWGETAGYYYLDFDLDNNAATGDHTQGDYGAFEAFMYLYIFGGSADDPYIKENPNGGGSGMTIDGIVADGNITDELIEIEMSVPRENLPAVQSGKTIRVLSWRSKDGTVIEQTYKVQ